MIVLFYVSKEYVTNFTYIFKTYDEYYTNVYRGTTIENKLEKQHN